MRNIVKVSIAAAFIFMIGIVILVIFTNNYISGKADNSNEDIATLNNIAVTAEENRQDLSALDKKDFEVDYVIIDLSNNILYSNVKSDHINLIESGMSVEKAMQKRYLHKGLTENDRIWGNVIILDDGLTTLKDFRNKFLIGAVICVLMVFIGMITFAVYVDKNVITPFKNLKDFAAKVAQGQLNEPLQMDRDNMFGAFSESFDIMREELAESKKRELELQKKERELVASLSHDLKTPVTGIKVTSELLQMRLSVKENEVSRSETEVDNESADISGKGSESEQIEFTRADIDTMSQDAKGIYQKAEQIDALVSDLFTAALDDLGEFKVSCNDEESKVLNNIVKSYDDRGLAVIGMLPEVIINIDKKRMSQVIGNVISNSYKYANTRIDISYRLSEGYLEMQIRDYGPGVPTDELDLITNKFYRGKKWQDTEKEGNGLGLYISKTLMNKMNGDLLTESDGEGLAVTLIISLS